MVCSLLHLLDVTQSEPNYSNWFQTLIQLNGSNNGSVSPCTFVFPIFILLPMFKVTQQRKTETLKGFLERSLTACTHADIFPHARGVSEGIQFRQQSLLQKTYIAFDKEAGDTLMRGRGIPSCPHHRANACRLNAEAISVDGIVSPPSTRGKHKAAVFRHGHMLPGGFTGK